MHLTPLLLLLAVPAANPTGNAFAFGGGWFDFSLRNDPAVELRVEYRSGRRPLRPLAALALTTDGSFYACVGLGFDVFFWDRRLVLTPSFSPGLYAKGGGKDLGYPLEFRSQLEVAYRFRNGSRLGLLYSHVSNGGLGKRNPGAESLVVDYELPLERLFGRRSR